ncbi:MAG: hypothetical protein ACRCVT_03740 [Leadbetterella sp.]
MLKKYKIVDDSRKGDGVMVPGFGMLRLDPENLTDEMAAAAIENGSDAFVEAEKAEKQSASIKAVVSEKNNVEPLKS